jgi:hypothetical protein
MGSGLLGRPDPLYQGGVENITFEFEGKPVPLQQ